MRFTAGFIGENNFETLPPELYAIDLTMCAIAYTLMVLALVARHGRDSDFARAPGSDAKGKISRTAHLVAIPKAFVSHRVALALIAAVAVIRIVPDRRFARAAAGH